MTGQYDSNPFDEDKANPFADPADYVEGAGRSNGGSIYTTNPASFPPASSSRFSPLPSEPSDLYNDRGAIVDIPLDSSKDLNKKENELQSKETELNKTQKEIAVNKSDKGERSDESVESGASSSKDSSTSSSSSSSSSLCSDEEEESSSSEEEGDGNEMEKELKEGEIDEDELEEVIFSSDGEDAVTEGPIKSKHEIEDPADCGEGAGQSKGGSIYTTNPVSAPTALSSRLSPLPPEPADLYNDRCTTLDVPLDSSKDLKKKENELQAKEAELNKVEKESVANKSDKGESSDESVKSGASSSKDSTTSSSSSSSLSSDEEDESSSGEEEEDGNEMEEDFMVEVEEGEIDVDELDEVIFGNDGEDAVAKGPIKSKHEIEDLPPVPPIEVYLEPHHQILPVGIVSSILGSRVIVQGSEKHSPLNEGSILWITETRLPLGRIDEIFGPVKNPYYIVRYNSDKEVPQAISIGVAISFVADFANHVLNEKYLYEKGYDASGVDDEAVNDEVEFSDDEKEAEYRRSLRQKKRDTNPGGNQESGFHKNNNKFKGSRFHKDKQIHSPQSRSSQPCHLHAPQAPVNIGRNNFNSAPGDPNCGTNIVSSSIMVQAIPSLQLNTLLRQGIQLQSSPPNMRVGFPPQPQSMGMQSGYFPQPQIMAMQGGAPLNWMPTLHQTHSLNNFVNGIIQNQQQLVRNVGVPGNLLRFGGESNPSVDLSFALLGLMAQGGFAQAPLGCGNVNQGAHGQTSQVLNQGEPGHIECYKVNLQGSSAINNNEQNRGQALPVVNQGGFGPVPFGYGNVDPRGSLAVSTNDQSNGQASPVVNQGGFSQMASRWDNANSNGQVSGVNSQSEMRPPTVPFERGRSSRTRGQKHYGSGGRHSFGHRGGSQM